MDALWAITALVAILTTLNAIALVALIRQVGLLHLRIRPLPALEGEGGPSVGQKLTFATNPWEQPFARGQADYVVLGFFSPTCKHCAPVLPAFESIARSSKDEAVVLVTEAELDRGMEYLSAQRIDLPVIAESGSFGRNGIPGAPFAVVVDRDGIALASGGVNTLEQIEWLLERARHVAMERAAERAPVPASMEAPSLEVAHAG